MYKHNIVYFYYYYFYYPNWIAHFAQCIAGLTKTQPILRLYWQNEFRVCTKYV